MLIQPRVAVKRTRGAAPLVCAMLEESTLIKKANMRSTGLFRTPLGWRRHVDR